MTWTTPRTWTISANSYPKFGSVWNVMPEEAAEAGQISLRLSDTGRGTVGGRPASIGLSASGQTSTRAIAEFLGENWSHQRVAAVHERFERLFDERA